MNGRPTPPRSAPPAYGPPRLDLEGDAVTVARELIGWTLVVAGVGGAIVETEAYREDDAASHSFPGPTRRNRVMFGPPGRLYVYRSYGIHWCVNIVCGPKGVGAAVLVRALEPSVGVDRMVERRGVSDPRLLASGPGRVGQALAAGPALDGAPATLRAPARRRRLAASARVGITREAERQWRFYDPDSPYVSRRPATRLRGGRAGRSSSGADA
jgi:DNA-3-methyladenine glycosylase